jgi:hypothetical protein
MNNGIVESVLKIPFVALIYSYIRPDPSSHSEGKCKVQSFTCHEGPEGE